MGAVTVKGDKGHSRGESNGCGESWGGGTKSEGSCGAGEVVIGKFPEGGPVHLCEGGARVPGGRVKRPRRGINVVSRERVGKRDGVGTGGCGERLRPWWRMSWWVKKLWRCRVLWWVMNSMEVKGVLLVEHCCGGRMTWIQVWSGCPEEERS